MLVCSVLGWSVRLECVVVDCVGVEWSVLD